MSIESLIQDYGYVALFIGAFLEGESIVAAAGFAAHRGYLSLSNVMLCAFVATALSDQLFFHIGRTRGRRFLARRPGWERKAIRVQLLLERHPYPLILGFRFLYGVRNVTPFVVGASGFPPRRFVALNVLSAAVWTAVVSMGGYAFGEVLERFIEDLRRYEFWVMGSLLGIGLLLWGALTVRSRLMKPTDQQAGQRERST